MNIAQRASATRTKRRTLSYDAIGIFLVSSISITAGIIFFCLKEKSVIEVAKEIEDEMQILVRLANIDVSYQENDDKLVYLSGELKTTKKLTDTLFDVSIHACKLKREVYMYQWVVLADTKEVDVGDRVKKEVVYQFEKRWMPQLVKLNYKGRKNPTTFPIPPLTLTAGEVSVGIFHLSPALSAQITNFRQLKIMHQTKAFTPKNLFGNEKRSTKSHLRNGALYYSDDPENPKIGDIMVQFSFAGLSISEDTSYGAAEIVSVVGKQKGKYITRYKAPNGSAIELIRFGKIEPEELLLSHLLFDRFLTWGYRLIAALAVFIGIALVSAIVPGLGRPRFVPVWLAGLLGHNRVILHIGTTLSLLLGCRCFVALFIADTPPSHMSTQFALFVASVCALYVITKQAQALQWKSRSASGEHGLSSSVHMSIMNGLNDPNRF